MLLAVVGGMVYNKKKKTKSATSTVAEAERREPSLIPVAKPVEAAALVAVAATPVAATLDEVTVDIVPPTNATEAAAVATATAKPVSQTESGNVTAAGLATKSVGELRKLAEATAIPFDAIEAARDGLDPKAELITLILGRANTTTQAAQP